MQDEAARLSVEMAVEQAGALDRKGQRVAIAGDGQVTMGQTVVKASAKFTNDEEANKLVANVLNDLFARAEAVPNTWH